MEERCNARRKTKRNFMTASKICIALFHMLAFGFVWINFYNLSVFRTHRLEGGIVSLLIYYIIYDNLARLYKAYKVGQYAIGETIFSQFLSFGIADMILYVECCLIAHGYVDILPGIMTFLMQLFGTIVWAVLAKRYYMKHIPAPNTLLIYGKKDVDVFSNKLEKKYSHLFDFQKMLPASEELDILTQAINQAEVVILYRIGFRKKSALLKYCVDHVKTFYITPDVTDILMEGFENRHMIDTPLMKYDSNRDTLARRISKRIMDIIVSLFGLIITLPISLLTMLAIKLEDGGAIFYKQERYTKNWKKFNILKFRSMIPDAEKDGALLCKQGDVRITKVGAFIRRFRIDEIPQLVNVLTGDMSLVGPRPERVENMEMYTEELPQFSYRLRVKGGLTGYAQLYGKYNTSAADKLKLDLMYIENQSFLMDLKLIMLTFKILFIPESTEGFSEEAVDRMKIGTDSGGFEKKVKGVL